MKTGVTILNTDRSTPSIMLRKKTEWFSMRIEVHHQSYTYIYTVWLFWVVVSHWKPLDDVCSGFQTKVSKWWHQILAPESTLHACFMIPINITCSGNHCVSVLLKNTPRSEINSRDMQQSKELLAVTVVVVIYCYYSLYIALVFYTFSHTFKNKGSK